MSERTQVWLVLESGPRMGLRYAVGESVTRIGRGLGNDVILEGADAATVSSEHLEIRREGDGFRIRDLDSTNGTFLNGERISEVGLTPPAKIRLGTQGPEFAFLTEPAAGPLDRTLVLSESPLPAIPEAAAPLSGPYDSLLSDAVDRARRARDEGLPNQTMTIMRETLHRALHHTGRRLRVTILLLFLGLLSVSTYAGWRIWGLTGEKETIDRRIRDIEAKLRSQNAAGDEADRLIAQLGAYEGEAEALRRSLLYRVGVREKDDFVTQEIRLLMAEFGAEVYSVPPDFADRVRVYIGQYQGSDRSLMARALTGAAPQFNTVRRILVENHLPPDLAYIPLVESALAPERASAAGAAGPWQFTPATAKAYGLSLGPPDERLHLASSTRAACRYMRELILEFGGGSSVMLALAAYNLGPTKVRQAVMDTVRDPIKQRNFWYLYRLRALPEETREYVPKTVAVMIIGRNPGRFGF